MDSRRRATEVDVLSGSERKGHSEGLSIRSTELEPRCGATSWSRTENRRTKTQDVDTLGAPDRLGLLKPLASCQDSSVLAC
jgi:hypothetical protein